MAVAHHMFAIVMMLFRNKDEAKMNSCGMNSNSVNACSQMHSVQVQRRHSRKLVKNAFQEARYV